MSKYKVVLGVLIVCLLGLLGVSLFVQKQEAGNIRHNEALTLSTAPMSQVSEKKVDLGEWNEVQKDTYYLFYPNHMCTVTKEDGTYTGLGYELTETRNLAEITLSSETLSEAMESFPEVRFYEFCKIYIKDLPEKVRKEL
jgi:hypothetical protein